ncbi:MAG: DMT family transporter [Luteimonas sp.]
MSTSARLPAPRPAWSLALLTALTMTAFAANSLLTRLALQTTTIDPASFGLVRIVAGATMLGLIVVATRGRTPVTRVGLASAALLFLYVVGFSYAYRHMDTGAGALVLFACAQLTMIAAGLVRGERTSPVGVALALAGLAVFLAPSPTAPPWGAIALMGLAGLAWGCFSLLGRAGDSPLAGTASAFFWSVPLALASFALQAQQVQIDTPGVVYAVVSGALTSALGYVLWYRVRVRMAAITAGTVQLSVPVISAVLGVWWLGEHLTLRSVVAGGVVLLGIALTTRATHRR